MNQTKIPKNSTMLIIIIPEIKKDFQKILLYSKKIYLKTVNQIIALLVVTLVT